MHEPSVARLLREAYAGIPPLTIMEVCGTHTHAIARYGLKKLLPPHVRVVSGPGCPVCVTADEDIRAALKLAERKETTLFSFGDMLRVPVVNAHGETDSLYRARGMGRDIRIAISPMDALSYAEENPNRTVVWFGVGFETTAPHTAVLVQRAQARGMNNLAVLSAHKTMPAALTALLGESHQIDALFCPGHVAVITGAHAFDFIPERLKLPAVIAGFQPDEIAAGFLAIADIHKCGTPALVNAYPGAVTAEGNREAQRLMRSVFVPCAAKWRGLGEIGESGLALSDAFSAWDARVRFSLWEPAGEAAQNACQCARVLRGEIAPEDCPLFGGGCTPDAPYGPCMVSEEGACAAAYLYAEE